jgi:hypothetical protein
MSRRPRPRSSSVVLLPLALAGLLLQAVPAQARTEYVDHLLNGSFEGGRTGWEAGAAGTSLTVVTVAGGRVARLSTSRTAAAVVTSRPRVVRATATGQRFVASALVRSTQAAQSGRLVIAQETPGAADRLRTTSVPLTRTWTRVSVTATAVSPGSGVQVRVRADGLRPGQHVFVDDVRLLGAVVAAPAPSVAPSVAPGPMLSNGCAYTDRGIPRCGALLGSAYGANTDPSTWEAQMGHQLGVHRTYYGASGVDAAVATASKDLAARRVPWVSFKLPYSWTDMADGRGDAWATDLATRLSRLDGPVWVAFHHEPEGDGAITEWTRMQAHLAPLVRRAAPNVAYSIILTGWHELYGATAYRLDAIMPRTTIDLLGFDVYDKFGVRVHGKVSTTHTNMRGDYFAKFQTWTRAHHMAWGLAETGFSDRSALNDPRWVQRTYTDLVATGGVAFTYFNTTLHSVAPWNLGTNAKKLAFTSALRTSPTI